MRTEKKEVATSQKKLTRQEHMMLNFTDFIINASPPVEFSFALKELVMCADTIKMNEDSRQSILILQEFLEDVEI